MVFDIFHEFICYTGISLEVQAVVGCQNMVHGFQQDPFEEESYAKLVRICTSEFKHFVHDN